MSCRCSCGPEISPIGGGRRGRRRGTHITGHPRQAAPPDRLVALTRQRFCVSPRWVGLSRPSSLRSARGGSPAAVCLLRNTDTSRLRPDHASINASMPVTDLHRSGIHMIRLATPPLLFRRLRRAARPGARDHRDVGQAVAAIIAEIRARGDSALLEYTARFDRLALTADRLRIPAGESIPPSPRSRENKPPRSTSPPPGSRRSIVPSSPPTSASPMRRA